MSGNEGLGLGGFNLAQALSNAMANPSQQAVNQQAAAGGGVLSAKNAISKEKRKRDAQRLINARCAQGLVLAKAKQVSRRRKA